MCPEVAEDDDSFQDARTSSFTDAAASMAGSSRRGHCPRRVDNSYDSATPLGAESAVVRAASLALRVVPLALISTALLVMTLASTETLGHSGGSHWRRMSSGVMGLVDGMCRETHAPGLLILAPCPSFMTLLRKEDYHGQPPPTAHMETWRIVFNGEVKVRAHPSFEALVKGTKKKCTIFRGALDNGWIQLPHNAGYVRQHIGKLQMAEQVHPGQVSAECTRQFRVVFNGRVKIRSQPTFQASITGRKWKCQIFAGEEDNGWIRLQGNTGFIRSHIGNTVLVEELKKGFPPGRCAPLIRQWRIVFEGKVNIRKQPSVNAPVLGVKWKCSKFVGQMDNGWIKLNSNAGYVKASLGATRLVEEIRDTGQEPCKPLADHQQVI